MFAQELTGFASADQLLERIVTLDWHELSALALSLAYLGNSADHPVIAAIGRRTLLAVLADAEA